MSEANSYSFIGSSSYMLGKEFSIISSDMTPTELVENQSYFDIPNSIIISAPQNSVEVENNNSTVTVGVDNGNYSVFVTDGNSSLVDLTTINSVDKTKGISIDHNAYTGEKKLTIASTSKTTYGVLKIDNNTLQVTSQGLTYVPDATYLQKGVITIDDNTLKVNSTAYGNQAYVNIDDITLQVAYADTYNKIRVIPENFTASTTNYGTVKIDGNTIINDSNKILKVDTKNLTKAKVSTLDIDYTTYGVANVYDKNISYLTVNYPTFYAVSLVDSPLANISNIRNFVDRDYANNLGMNINSSNIESVNEELNSKLHLLASEANNYNFIVTFSSANLYANRIQCNFNYSDICRKYYAYNMTGYDNTHNNIKYTKYFNDKDEYYNYLQNSEINYWDIRKDFSYQLVYKINYNNAEYFAYYIGTSYTFDNYEKNSLPIKVNDIAYNVVRISDESERAEHFGLTLAEGESLPTILAGKIWFVEREDDTTHEYKPYLFGKKTSERLGYSNSGFTSKSAALDKLTEEIKGFKFGNDNYFISSRITDNSSIAEYLCVDETKLTAAQKLKHYFLVKNGSYIYGEGYASTNLALTALKTYAKQEYSNKILNNNIALLNSTNIKKKDPGTLDTGLTSSNGTVNLNLNILKNSLEYLGLNGTGGGSDNINLTTTVTPIIETITDNTTPSFVKRIEAKINETDANNLDINYIYTKVGDPIIDSMTVKPVSNTSMDINYVSQLTFDRWQDGSPIFKALFANKKLPSIVLTEKTSNDLTGIIGNFYLDTTDTSNHTIIYNTLSFDELADYLTNTGKFITKLENSAIASETTKGILSVNTTHGLTISDGELNISYASSTNYGSLKLVNSNSNTAYTYTSYALNISNNGELYAKYATTRDYGVVKPDSYTLVQKPIYTEDNTNLGMLSGNNLNDKNGRVLGINYDPRYLGVNMKDYESDSDIEDGYNENRGNIGLTLSGKFLNKVNNITYKFNTMMNGFYSTPRLALKIKNIRFDNSNVMTYFKTKDNILMDNIFKTVTYYDDVLINAYYADHGFQISRLPVLFGFYTYKTSAYVKNSKKDNINLTFYYTPIPRADLDWNNYADNTNGENNLKYFENFFVSTTPVHYSAMNFSQSDYETFFYDSTIKLINAEDSNISTFINNCLTHKWHSTGLYFRLKNKFLVKESSTTTVDTESYNYKDVTINTIKYYKLPEFIITDVKVIATSRDGTSFNFNSIDNKTKYITNIMSDTADVEKVELYSVAYPRYDETTHTNEVFIKLYKLQRREDDFAYYDLIEGDEFNENYNISFEVYGYYRIKDSDYMIDFTTTDYKLVQKTSFAQYTTDVYNDLDLTKEGKLRKSDKDYNYSNND